ncbi:flagellar brake protein [Variovorax arabinosiphilus]|uniref:flagellar brake protein n=1 Tax=Variovorax arabinosiphilus TaxID=3053498 RepID=UPI002575BB17|nr:MULTISPECIES: flagellar brake protein [unclassified Variovorax]MDM0119194.1 flagellar brake protein [Variovorax sp. J2L1-78]MDM0129620.1 flagellar brake protein [Variovorax sp. J2L1-63]MDM0232594.1 flagellar brake protein [Variovorax sp. J2R1-6]
MENKSSDLADAPSQTHTSPGESDDEFGHRDPIVVGARLRNLVNGGDFLTIQFASGQLVTQLLDVDTRARTFTVDWGASTRQNEGLLAAQRCQFSAQPEGVRVEFATAAPRETRFEGLPAFELDFPEVLYYLQRREHFRVGTPVQNAYTCTGSLPSGGAFSFEVHDLSLGGVAIRTTDKRVADWSTGASLRNCELSLGTFGRLSIDLELVSRRPTVLPNGGQRHLLGFRFLTLPGNVEGKLQRLITQLELKGNTLAR